MFWFLYTKRPLDQRNGLCHSSFILISFKVHSELYLAFTCRGFCTCISGPILHPPSPELKTHYHPNVEIIIDDEAREASVEDIFWLFLSLIILCLYWMELVVFIFYLFLEWQWFEPFCLSAWKFPFFLCILCFCPHSQRPSYL